MKWYLWLVLGAVIGYVGYMMWKRNKDAKMVAVVSRPASTTVPVITSTMNTGTI